MPKGLYIHVPFCLRKCRYCDFYSVTDLSLAEAYTKAAARNIAALDFVFDTVYFGGGTPSLLSPGQLSEMLSAAKLTPAAEISIECNPNSVSPDRLKALRDTGVNRLSLGIQSFCDSELKALGRLHTAREAEAAVRSAYSAGFENISADIMLAVPGQTRESLSNSLDILDSLPLTHLSAYMIKVEEGTPLSRDGELLSLIPDEEETADMYLYAAERLKNSGLFQYEISNFAKKGFECRHNLKYWHCEEYAGIGPAAHSFIDGERYRCPPDVKKFIGDSLQEKIFIERGGDRYERAMLSLRLTGEGLRLAEYPDAAEKASVLADKGLAEIKNGSLTLTPKGCLVSNQIILFLGRSIAAGDQSSAHI